VDTPGSPFGSVLLHGGDLLSSYSEGMVSVQQIFIFFMLPLSVRLSVMSNEKPLPRRMSFHIETAQFAIVWMQDLVIIQQAYAGIFCRDRRGAAAQLSEAE